MTGPAKAATHVDDATVAVVTFCACLQDPRARNAVDAKRPLLRLGADADLFRRPCLVITAVPPRRAGAGPAAEQRDAAGLDPTSAQPANRDLDTGRATES